MRIFVEVRILVLQAKIAEAAKKPFTIHVPQKNV